MSEFAIRRAKISDAAVIAMHRARMFQEMGDVPAENFEALRSGAERWLIEAFSIGEIRRRAAAKRSLARDHTPLSSMFSRNQSGDVAVSARG